MKKIIVFFFILLILFPGCTRKEIAMGDGPVNIIENPGFDPTGDWTGQLNAGGAILSIVFHIVKEDNGNYNCTIDSPDQNAFSLPTSEINIKENNLVIKSSKFKVVYKGTFKEPDTLEGKWKQGLALLPLNMKLQAQPVTYAKPQDPKEPYPYNSVDVIFKNKVDGNTLAGTLTYPKNGSGYPAVVLISGSGQQNRNVEIMGHRPFLVLADYLTRNNIAVLRYDDRGVGQSEGDLSTATSLNFAADASAAVDFLQKQSFFNTGSIGLIGHSEGGIIAPMVASDRDDISFIVLLAGPGFPGDIILMQQSEAILRASGASEEDIKKAAVTNRKIYDIIKEDDPETAAGKIRKILQSTGMEKARINAQVTQVTHPWFRFFLTHDPRPVLESLKIPVCAIDGSLDLQVPAKKNLGAIKAALQAGGNTQFVVKEFPGLNHLFQTAKTGLVDEYAKIQETMAPEVLEFISGWINGLDL